MSITITNPSGLLSMTARVDDSGVAPLGAGHDAGSIYFGNNFFLDISKTVAFRKSDYTDYDAVDLDANGWPVRIPSGMTHLKLYLYANAESNTTGEYLLRWNSSVDLTLTAAAGVSLSNASWDGASGTADLTITGDGEVKFALSGGGAGDLTGFGGVQVLPKRTFANAGGLTGVQLSDAGRNWNPEYLDLFKVPDANGRADRKMFFVRFMDLNTVNDITGVRDTADVKTLAHARWTVEVPPALGVEFAQYVQPVYIWWCFPNRSTDAYQQAVMNILKGATAYCKVALERGNEDWNPGFAPTSISWASGVSYFASQGVSGFFTASGASMTAGSRDIQVGTGEGANFTPGMVLAVGADFLGSVASVSGDVVTIDRDHDLATGTYDVSTGPYDARYDWHSIEIERLRTNAEAVFASTDDFVTVISAQRISGVHSEYFTTPYWLEADPARPDPATRHDWFSVASYYNGTLTEAMVTTFQTDQAQAVTDFHTAQLTGIATLAGQLSAIREDLDVLAPGMPIVPYEGGIHSLDQTTDDSWTTYDNTHAVPLVNAWRDDETKQAEAQAAFWDAQKPMECACQFLMVRDTSTVGSWGLRHSMTESDQLTAQLLALAGRSVKASFGG